MAMLPYGRVLISLTWAVEPVYIVNNSYYYCLRVMHGQCNAMHTYGYLPNPSWYSL